MAAVAAMRTAVAAAWLSGAQPKVLLFANEYVGFTNSFLVAFETTSLKTLISDPSARKSDLHVMKSKSFVLKSEFFVLKCENVWAQQCRKVELEC